MPHGISSCASESPRLASRVSRLLVHSKHMIIAFLGRSRVGKDTAAQVLVKEYGFVVARLSAPVKAAVQALFGFTHAQMHDAAKEDIDPRYGITPRAAMVQMTEHVHATLPKQFCADRIAGDLTASPNVVIPDLRYAHDVDFVRSIGGHVVKISRPLAPVVHEHEMHIDGICGDASIENGAEQQVFEKQIRGLFMRMRGASRPSRDSGSSAQRYPRPAGGRA